MMKKICVILALSCVLIIVVCTVLRHHPKSIFPASSFHEAGVAVCIYSPQGFAGIILVGCDVSVIEDAFPGFGNNNKNEKGTLVFNTRIKLFRERTFGREFLEEFISKNVVSESEILEKMSKEQESSFVRFPERYPKDRFCFALENVDERDVLIIRKGQNINDIEEYIIPIRDQDILTYDFAFFVTYHHTGEVSCLDGNPSLFLGSVRRAPLLMFNGGSILFHERRHPVLCHH